MELFFRIITPAVILAFVLHRGYYTRHRSQPQSATLEAREESAASRIAALLAVAGMAATAIYVFAPTWLAWADLDLPDWLRWSGVGMALAGFALLQWAQTTLGRSWSDQPRLLQGQELVTGGPYRWIRHPIYSAFILILGSLLLISANWLVGLCWLGMVVLEVSSRVRYEESLMLAAFGDQYREYMNHTGRLLPRMGS